jgi:hypothetical protein
MHHAHLHSYLTSVEMWMSVKKETRNALSSLETRETIYYSLLHYAYALTIKIFITYYESVFTNCFCGGNRVYCTACLFLFDNCDRVLY